MTFDLAAESQQFETRRWLPLYSDRRWVGQFEASFPCVPDRANHFLAVRKSIFQLTSPQEGTPLLARCHPGHSGLLSQVHLPVGGARPRPCLEDFLDMLTCR